MRGLGTATVLIAAVGVFALSGVGKATGSQGTAPVARVPSQVTTFLDVQFPESLATDLAGNLYASVTTFDPDNDFATTVKEVVKINPDGSKARFGPAFVADGTGLSGIVTGVAFDALGRLYVADASFSDDPLPGVYRIDAKAKAPVRVVTLPPDAFPNGLAFRGGDLYISDSTQGRIWRAHLDLLHPQPQTLSVAWLADTDLFGGVDGETIGANGIAFRGTSLYVAVADLGQIVRVPVLPGGTAGTPVVVKHDPALVTADGIAFDVFGNLYVAVNEPAALLVLHPNGLLAPLGGDTGWLNYPTQPVFGSLFRAPTTLYVENGEFDGPTTGVPVPDIRAIHTAIPGVVIP